MAYQRQLVRLGMVPCMSRKGNCYDNAVAESFFSTLKNELVHHQTYHTRDEARQEIVRVSWDSTIASGPIRVWRI